MEKLKYKCDAILKDPFFNGNICNKKAINMIKNDDKKGYIYPRCGIHSRNYDKIELYPKKKKKKDDINNENNKEPILNLNELLEYIENKKCIKDIPIEIEMLFKEIDNLNDNIKNIITN